MLRKKLMIAGDAQFTSHWGTQTMIWKTFKGLLTASCLLFATLILITTPFNLGTFAFACFLAFLSAALWIDFSNPMSTQDEKILDKKETKQKITELLKAGKSKSEVFQTLSGSTLKDSQLAYFIASYPNPHLYYQHDKKINVLITIMFIQALFGALIGFVAGSKIGPTATWIFAIFCALIPLFFAYGFYKNYAATYNAYIILSIIQLPKIFTDFTQTSIASTIGLILGLALLGYVWYVRSLLFPDFAFIAPKKVKGQYVFNS